MQPPDTPSRRLAALLRDRRDELSRRWTERVLRDPQLGSSRELSEPELEDDIPEIIDEIVRVLDAAQASEASGRDLGASDAAKRHAQLRLARSFSLAETVREFSHFRAALVDLCNAAGKPLEGEAAALVHATIDENMVTSASEMERARLADAAQEAAFRERFVGILSHDLKSPLHAVRFALDALLTRKDTTPEQAKILHRAVASAERMARMVHDLLDLTRARLGDGIPIDRKPVALDELCRQVVDEVSIVHPGRAITLDVEGAVRGEYDPDRIAQVVSNLVGNALVHGAPEAPVRVTVRAEGGGAFLSVHNQGRPIPPDALPHLFDPFWRAQDSPGGSREDSLGLGLFIVKQLVEAHGGSVAVASTAADGTTFSVRLPLRAPGG